MIAERSLKMYEGFLAKYQKDQIRRIVRGSIKTATDQGAKLQCCNAFAPLQTRLLYPWFEP